LVNTLSGNSRKNKDVVIWTEGGKGIGLGHVRRCLVIAQELKKRNIDILFFVNDDPSAIEWIKKEGFHYEIASLTKPPLLNIDTPDKGLTLIDTKKPVSGLIRSLKKMGHKIVLLDNVTDARLEADCVIYPTAIYENNMDWKNFRGTVFGGSKYVLISRSFIEVRKKTVNKKLEPPYYVLVTLGGSDPNHLTGKIVSALLKSKVPLNIKAVIGPAFSSDFLLDALTNHRHDNVQFIKGKDDLSADIADSHIAITALGTTIFELACLGVPALIIANYRTDEHDMTAFEKLGIALPLGYYKEVSDFDIQNTVASILDDKAMWKNMSSKGKKLIDGHGAERIAHIVENLF
jgi:spore coat polysaccharide biosynthesis predicted glycosyltransferase SpsG